MEKQLLIAIWLIIIGLAGWTAVSHWSSDPTATWTSIAIIVLLIIAFFVMRLKNVI